MYSSLLPAKLLQSLLKTHKNFMKAASLSPPPQVQTYTEGVSIGNNLPEQHLRSKGRQQQGKKKGGTYRFHICPQYLKLPSPISQPLRECGCLSAPSPSNCVRKTTPVLTGQPPRGTSYRCLSHAPLSVLLGKAEMWQVGLERLQ